MIRFFLYARKSTDEEDRQVLSIEAQLQEVRDHAKRENLHVLEEFVESRTAKVPGRPIFNKMIDSIQKGKADGIVAWHPDRLARNSVDGGLIIYLLDIGKRAFLKFPTFWFDNTPQGKFMLNIAFGQSKYYVDNLRENVMRGIRQKLRRGEYPGMAPVGYLNDYSTRTVVVDEAKAPLIRKLFETFVSGHMTVKALCEVGQKLGIKSRKGRPIEHSSLHSLLSNPFYTGLLRYNGEIHEASHPPIISRALFDRAQELLHRRRKTQTRCRHFFVFQGLLKCRICGCSITAEKQKGHIYYHCTKKKGPCPGKCLREEYLAQQLREVILQVALPESWINPIANQIEAWKEEREKNYPGLLQILEDKLLNIDLKLEKLLQIFRDSAIKQEEYAADKEKLLGEKQKLKDKITRLKRDGNLWLEPLKETLHLAFQAFVAAQEEDSIKIRDFLRAAGPNLVIVERQVCCEWKTPWNILANFIANLKKQERFSLNPEEHAQTRHQWLRLLRNAISSRESKA